MKASRNRRGSAVYTIAVVGLLVGACALAVDAGYVYVAQNQLQTTTDAAAHAAAHALDGSPDGLDFARKRIDGVISRASVYGNRVELQRLPLFGYLDESGVFVESTDASKVDVVRVSARVPDLGMFFAPATNARAVVTLNDTAAARRPFQGGAGAVDCFLPFAVASCLFDSYDKSELATITMLLNTPGIHNMGYARPLYSPNAEYVKSQIQHCRADGEVEIGDPVGLNNGELTTALFTLGAQIGASDTRWTTERLGPLPDRIPKSAVPIEGYGNTLEAPILVFDGGSDYCSGGGGTFTGYEPIVGFSWGVVWDVQAVGAVEDKQVMMRIDPNVDRAVGLTGGGPSWGVTFKQAGGLIDD